jgi:hypothetical protein
MEFMINKEVIFGFFLGLILAFVGSFLYLQIVTDYDLFRDFDVLNQYGILSKVITLGTMLSVAAFLLFFYKKKDSIARGILFSIITLLIVTFLY